MSSNWTKAGCSLTLRAPICYSSRLTERPHRLAWPRTSAFQAGNTGSNPVGDTTFHGAPEFGQERQITTRSGYPVLYPIALPHRLTSQRLIHQCFEKSPCRRHLSAEQGLRICKARLEVAFEPGFIEVR